VNLKAVDAAGHLMGVVSLSKPFLPQASAWVITLGVARDFRRQGLGNRLLHEAEKRTTAPRIRLTVRASNGPAIDLYLKAGYALLRQATRYYPDGEDGLIMEKRR
ncbi:MAG: GNAT family N-acetyltransferase, partial [Anaerolineales bacterium]